MPRRLGRQTRKAVLSRYDWSMIIQWHILRIFSLGTGGHSKFSPSCDFWKAVISVPSLKAVRACILVCDILVDQNFVTHSPRQSNPVVSSGNLASGCAAEIAGRLLATLRRKDVASVWQISSPLPLPVIQIFRPRVSYHVHKVENIQTAMPGPRNLFSSNS